MSNDLIVDELVATLSRLDQYASVPADLCFDDAPVETIVYGEPGRTASPANLFVTARDAAGGVLERSGLGIDADVLELTSQLVSQRHALIVDGYKSIRPLLPLLCDECLNPQCPWDVQAILAGVIDLADQRNDLPMRILADQTREIWLRGKVNSVLEIQDRTQSLEGNP